MSDRITLTSVVSTSEVMAFINTLRESHGSNPLAAVICAVTAANVIGTKAFKQIVDQERLAASINEAAEELGAVILHHLDNPPDDTPDVPAAGRHHA